MRKYLFLAAAATVVATPAVARDGAMYVGIEAGGMIVENTGLDFRDDDDDIQEAFNLRNEVGLDADVIAGYDFGAVRAEVELGYKRASLEGVDPLNITGVALGFLDADGHTRVISGMANVMLDFGDDNGWSGYVGPGLGLASVRYRAEITDTENPTVFALRAQDQVLAWQVVAGVRRALGPNLDLGLKYRFFNTARFRFEEDDGAGVSNPPFDLNGKYHSHSLLASLIYNFGAPLPPPPPVVVAPPPPPPPATKTCPDGSVVLATDPCPLPPPPPPPPPPLPERG